MALTLKGTPQKVTALAASLPDVSKDAPAKQAVKAAKEAEERRKRGGANGTKAR
jgi:hypothetical protein